MHGYSLTGPVGYPALTFDFVFIVMSLLTALLQDAGHS